eukprot:TRINITY_DN25779_c0_g2_i1.p1 TRINITY_DN25779_c0_g2~~TRINITY_DN25779_c0_g2_i1.p1  ORF type:complete len:320 (+),score=58.31 TRINITY_DN25779_c0_g2_i1:89-1048(+)
MSPAEADAAPDTMQSLLQVLPAASCRTALMPWQEPGWPVALACLSAISLMLFVVITSVVTSKTCRARFAAFWHGDISAFLAERWRMTVPLVPVGALLYFATCWLRHPLQTAAGDELIWNKRALYVAGAGCVGVAGLGICTQNDNTKSSTYPLQNDIVHGVFMVSGFGGLFLYQALHAGVLLSESRCVLDLPLFLACIELTYCLATLLHFARWQHESSKERFPDDPCCDKRNEWFCMVANGGFLLTLPVLVCATDVDGTGARGGLLLRFVAPSFLGAVALLLLALAAVAPQPRAVPKSVATSDEDRGVELPPGRPGAACE